MTIIDALRPELSDGVSISTDEGPESWIEARLDLLIAQECFADLEFAGWLANQAGVRGPDGATLASTEVAISVDDRDVRIPNGAHGETDVQIVLDWSDGSTSVVLIEDKVWAGFQPRQLQRYRDRSDAIGAKCLLIAPAAYLGRLNGEGDLVDGVVSIEAIAQRIVQPDDRRSEWTSTYLLKLIERKSRKAGVSDPATVAFTEHCIDWFAENAPHVIPQRLSLHTLGQGWLEFEVPAALTYKVVGLKADAHALVDLYLDQVDGHHVDLPIGSRGPIDGFVFDRDTAHNPVLRYRCEKLDPHTGVPSTDAERAALHAALSACVRATDWALACGGSAAATTKVR